MGKVARSYRLDEGLVARLEARADELGQTRTVFVERALEAALGDGQVEAETRADTARVAPSRSASPRASEPKSDEVAIRDGVRIEAIPQKWDKPFRPMPKGGS